MLYTYNSYNIRNTNHSFIDIENPYIDRISLTDWKYTYMVEKIHY